MRKFFFFIFLSLGISMSAQSFQEKLVAEAYQLTYQNVVYDPAYVVIPYPNGDVLAGRGVCTDVVIRAYRKMGIDLQKEVHEDMKANFNLYPKNWGLSRPDKNIDHRRVLNLMRFFERHGTTLPITQNNTDYKPGDIVCWDLGGGALHIGIVSDRKIANTNRYGIVHNVGAGQVHEDFLFEYKIIGHYKYDG
ncbi:MAG: DUF1287 domain-containing protein [Bacteroidales bacterium]|jgi:uncharacterized protein YijF (DUF1287 family)|nr:DUF1287 domain-containing protein [Bacteroidales bacterium]